MNFRKTVAEVDKKYHARQVVLVDESDRELGVVGLVEAHRGEGLKHRAFSLQLYRIVGEKKELLLQQRAVEKPVFPYLWANTSCYNMAPGEQYLNRAVSRVNEELGIQVQADKLRELYKFSYEASDIEGWRENELDNVMVGEWDGVLKMNPEEVVDTRWVEWGELNVDIEQNSDKYSPWFKMIVKDPRFRSVFE